MAFLGDFGKIFLGGASTGTAIGALTGNPALAAGAQRAADVVSKVARAGRTEQGQATAVSVTDTPPAETQFSGESVPASSPIYAPTFMAGASPAAFGRAPMPAAGMGGVTPAGLPAIVGGGVQVSRGFLGPFLSGAGVAMLAPTIIDPFTGQEKKLRVTRRLRSQVKRAVEMFGVEQVANQMGLDVEGVFYILTKKMRNDGPYVTKAAVRKTRQTVRKMKHLCDMYDDLRPPARRAAARRTTSKTTLIKN